MLISHTYIYIYIIVHIHIYVYMYNYGVLGIFRETETDKKTYKFLECNGYYIYL